MNYDWRIEARKQRNHPITYDSVINKYEFKKNNMNYQRKNNFYLQRNGQIKIPHSYYDKIVIQSNSQQYSNDSS